jgi:hypothetical protein
MENIDSTVNSANDNINAAAAASAGTSASIEENPYGMFSDLNSPSGTSTGTGTGTGNNSPYAEANDPNTERPNNKYEPEPFINNGQGIVFAGDNEDDDDDDGDEAGASDAQEESPYAVINPNMKFKRPIFELGDTVMVYPYKCTGKIEKIDDDNFDVTMVEPVNPKKIHSKYFKTNTKDGKKKKKKKVDKTAILENVHKDRVYKVGSKVHVSVNSGEKRRGGTGIVKYIGEHYCHNPTKLIASEGDTLDETTAKAKAKLKCENIKNKNKYRVLVKLDNDPYKLAKNKGPPTISEKDMDCNIKAGTSTRDNCGILVVPNKIMPVFYDSIEGLIPPHLYNKVSRSNNDD